MRSSLTDELRLHPYFMQPVIDALAAPGCDPRLRARLKQRLAVNISSSPALRDLLALDSEPLSDFYGEGPDTPSTLDTIDTFLSHFCNTQNAAPAIPTTAPADELEESMADDAPEETPEDTTASCIDAFLKAQPPRRPRPRRPLGETPLASPAEIPAPLPPQPPRHSQEDYSEPDVDEESTDPDTETEIKPSASSSSTLTEGFARILIKNGNFSKALEIITQLNLKNPEKSIYFADQIRFLRKLIANQEKF